jgi:ankyrin repeat protein
MRVTKTTCLKLLISGGTMILVSAIGCRRHNTEVIKRSANYTTQGKLPFGSDMREAIASNQVATVKVLLDSGEDVNGTNAFFETPLGDAIDKAATPESIAVTKLLLDSGANPNQAASQYSYFPINIAADYASLPVMKLLVEAGADVNSLDGEGTSALTKAIEAGAADDLVLYLIEHGANVNLHGKDIHGEQGLSPLFASVRMPSNSRIVDTLLQHGALPSKDECRLTLRLLQNHGQADTAEKIASRSPCK